MALSQSDEVEIASLEARGGDLASMVGKRDALDEIVRLVEKQCAK